jgi:hypothetical protein
MGINKIKPYPMRTFTVEGGVPRRGIQVSRVSTLERVAVPVIAVGGDGSGRFRFLLPVTLEAASMAEIEAGREPIIMAAVLATSLKGSQKVVERTGTGTTPQALILVKGKFAPVTPDLYPPKILGKGRGTEEESLVAVSQGRPFIVENSHGKVVLAFDGLELQPG